MPSRRGTCRQQSPCSSLESPPSILMSGNQISERYHSSVRFQESSCLREPEAMSINMTDLLQPSSSSMEPSPPDVNSSSRYHRNLAEKQRRDKLNGYITELATIVPMASMTTKRLDKTSILRLSAAYLRIYQSKLNPRKCKKCSWGPNILNSDHLNELLQASGGFLLIASFPEKVIYGASNAENLMGQQHEHYNGKVIYVSPNVEKTLGQQNIDMIGQSMFQFIHPDDAKYVYDKLKSLAQFSKQRLLAPNRNVFCARMRKKNVPRSEALDYQLMNFSCFQDTDDEDLSQQIKHSSLNTAKPAGMEVKSDILITAFIKPLNSNPFNELSITEAFQEEYVTRHGLDGKILFADHRISTITGHLPSEVHGMSAYEYIIEKDIPIAHLAQKRMFSSIDGTGMIVYRLRTASHSSVYLKSIGHLQFEKNSAKVHQFICINKLMSEEDGEKELQKFVEHYTPHVNNSSCPDGLPMFPDVSSITVPCLLDTTVCPKVRSPISSSSGVVSHSKTRACSIASSPISSMIPAVNGRNGDAESFSVPSGTYSSEIAFSPNTIFDFDSSNFVSSVPAAQHCVKDDLLHEDFFHNGYYAVASALCPQIPRELNLSPSHATDLGENSATLQRFVSKRKRGLDDMYTSSSHSLEVNSAAKLIKSKYAKFSTESCGTVRRETNFQAVGISEENFQSSIGHHEAQVNIRPSERFLNISQKDICGEQLQDSYLISLGNNVMDCFEPVNNVPKRPLNSAPQNPRETVPSVSDISAKVNINWRFKGDDSASCVGKITGDDTSPCGGRINGSDASPYGSKANSVQSPHFSGCVLQTMEYQNAADPNAENLIVDQSGEWLRDSYTA